MDNIRIAVISASLGDIDNDLNTVNPKQKIDVGYELEFFFLTDKNFPPRYKSLHPRLHAKIPKMLAYELYPTFDYYIWFDGSFTLKNENSVMNFVKSCEGYDACFFSHPHRTKLNEEFAFMYARMKDSKNLQNRYQNEYIDEQRQLYLNLEGAGNQPLYALGSFIYHKNLITKQEFNIFQQWFYHNCRYSVQDQLSLPYLFYKNKNIYDIGMLKGDIINNNEYVTYYGHK